MLRLIAVGKLRDGPEAELFARYNARLRPQFAVTEIAEARGAVAEVKRREGQALLAALPDPAFVVALDPSGAMPDSEEFSRFLERWLAAGRPVCFLIGGAEGLDAAGDRTRRLSAVARAHDVAAPAVPRHAGRADLSRAIDRRGASVSPRGQALIVMPAQG